VNEDERFAVAGAVETGRDLWRGRHRHIIAFLSASGYRRRFAVAGRLRLTVRPRIAVRYRRMTFRFRVTAGGRPVAGARVHLSRSWATTGKAGIARISYRFRGRAPFRHPTARSAGRTARALLRVVSHR
jgi:hypothetical protein